MVPEHINHILNLLHHQNASMRSKQNINGTPAEHIIGIHKVEYTSVLVRTDVF